MPGAQRKRLLFVLIALIGLILICCVIAGSAGKPLYNRLIGDRPGVGPKAELGYQALSR